MAYNLVQMADFLKGLDNQKLQAYLQQPPGEIPAFLIAAEAARRKDVETQMAAQNPQSPQTVLDDLISSRAQAQGVNQIPAPQQAAPQMAQQAPTQGIAGLQPGMADGGPVRRFQAAGYVDPFGGYTGITEGDAEGSAGGYTGYDIGNSIARGLGGLVFFGDSIPPLFPESPAALKPVDTIKPFNTGFTNSDRQAAAVKQSATDKKQAEMGNPQNGSQSTQPNGAEATSKRETELRAQLDEMMTPERETNPLGLSTAEWFALSAEFFNPENRGIGQALANGGLKVAQSMEARDAAYDLAQREHDKAMWQWDAQAYEDEQARKTAQAENQLKSMQYMGEQAMEVAKMHQSAVTSIQQALNKRMAEIQQAQTQMGTMDSAAINASIASDPEIKSLQEQLQQETDLMNNALASHATYTKNYGSAYGTYDPTLMWTPGKGVHTVGG